MARDLKYGEITAEHGDVVHGVPGIPLNDSDEIVFIIRSQDIAGPDAVRAYAVVAGKKGAPVELADAVMAVAEEMDRWQAEHPHLVKVAD